MRIAIAFSLIFISFLSYSQRVELKSIDPILCFNDKNGELTVIDDTNWINTYSAGGKLVTQSKILKKAVNFSELKAEFIPVFLHKKLHFVEKGSGRVLRFEKGNIERIDHSFSHRNQFNALVLEFNDTLYCVGGYGFFTIKVKGRPTGRVGAHAHQHRAARADAAAVAAAASDLRYCSLVDA